MQAFRCADRRLGVCICTQQWSISCAARWPWGVRVCQCRCRWWGGGGRSWFTAAAALTEMAGWMAHDCGRDADAWRHLDRSRDLVRVDGDRQSHAHVLASVAHTADHAGRPTVADRLACEGLNRLRAGPADPDLEARLLALRARSAAARGERGECMQLLTAAERSLGLEREEPRSAWVNQLDEAALASETARCMLRLGELGQTRRQAERVVALRPADRAPRSHAFAKLVLIAALAAENDWDAVCALGREVLDSTASLGSVLVLQQLNALRQRLEQTAGRTGVVEEFLDELSPALRQRWWLQTRLPAVAGGGGSGGRWVVR